MSAPDTRPLPPPDEAADAAVVSAANDRANDPSADAAAFSDFSTFYLQSGPLPSAEELGRYEAISPGLAEAFIRLYAESAARENDRADRAASARERNHTIALVCAFLLAVLAGFGGMDALAQGDTAAGLTLSGGSLSALVFAFLKATESR